MTAYKESVGADTQEVFNRVFLTDFNMAWVAAQEAMKSMRIEESKVEAGFIRTQWADNTAEKNFIDSFGASETHLKAQYRFRVTVGKGFYNGKPSVKVTVQKDQLVQHDVLEGWKPAPTDSIDENTLLYRINRLITIRTKISRLEEEKVKNAVESTSF